mmetsp:Transcript_18852/g.72674  ORF Transcript_18852/g.72674 Transcript_18852/m.72674 type:complete len:160 (+) Transcript_18852:300-779(+)
MANGLAFTAYVSFAVKKFIEVYALLIVAIEINTVKSDLYQLLSLFLVMALSYEVAFLGCNLKRTVVAYSFLQTIGIGLHIALNLVELVLISLLLGIFWSDIQVYFRVFLFMLGGQSVITVAYIVVVAIWLCVCNEKAMVYLKLLEGMEVTVDSAGDATK